MAGMVVQHNMNALNAYNRLNYNVNGLKKASEKLSSGYRINRAGDDAAGLAISEKMRSQIRGLNQAKRNSQDGISMIQTFEGALQESHSILQRMKELAAESANGTYQDDVDRDAIQLEFDQLNDELNQIADTDFNGVVMLNGGVMADGTEAVDGKFDYAAAKAAAEAAAAEAAANTPKDLVSGDYSEKAASLDDSKFTNATAKQLFDNAVDAGAAKEGDTELYIKYTVSGVDDDGKANAWTAEYVDAEGNKLADATAPTADGNGGFAGTAASDNVNVVTDTIGTKVGDFVTVKYTKPAGDPQAPENIGFEDSNDNSGVVVSGDIPHLTEDVAKTATIALDAGVTDTAWTAGDAAAKNMQDGIAALDGTTIKVTYTTANDTNAITPAFTIGDGTGSATSGLFIAADGSITYNGTAIGSFTAATLNSANAAGQVGTVEYTIAVDGYRVESDEKANAVLVEGAAAAEEETAGVSKSNAYDAATAPLTYSDSVILQVGSRTKDAVDFTFNYETEGMGKLQANMDVSAREGGLNTANLSLATQEDANAAIDQIDNAINKVSMIRATFGATQNRLEHKIENLTTTAENLTEAESTIRDTDMASEMMNYTKYNILQQAAQSMLAQANQQPQSILQLLG